MSLEDRDWYREVLARRVHLPVPELRGRHAKRCGLWLVVTAAELVLAAPVFLTSRCDQGAWRIEPIACWQWSWAALGARVARNLAPTHGYPVVVVETRKTAVPTPIFGACGYYINSSGHQVPRPCGDWRTNQGTTPRGATALCADGRYSYSEHPDAPGTCSYHGGVVARQRNG